MIKAILFDLDGIIVDSEPLHFEAAKFALEEYGIHLSVKEYLEFGAGKGAWRLFEKMSEQYGIAIDMEKAFKKKTDTFQMLFKSEAKPREGVLEFIGECVRGGYAIAVASSGMKSNVHLALSKLDIIHLFSSIITFEDVHRPKPFPDIYLKSCASLNLEVSECMAIEDSETGVEAVKAAGMVCVAVPCDFTKHQNFSKADYVFESFSNIPRSVIFPLC